MVYRGTIKNRGVMLPIDVTFPDGTEVLVALPDSWAELEAGPAIPEHLAELGCGPEAGTTDRPPHRAAHFPQGANHPSGQGGLALAEERPEYPVADFLSPTEYAWDEDVYAAEEAVRAYLNDSHADH